MASASNATPDSGNNAPPPAPAGGGQQSAATPMAPPLGAAFKSQTAKAPVSPFVRVVKADANVKRLAIIGLGQGATAQTLDAPVKVDDILHKNNGFDLTDLVKRGIAKWCDSNGHLLSKEHIDAAIAGTYRPGEDGLGTSPLTGAVKLNISDGENDGVDAHSV